MNRNFEVCDDVGRRIVRPIPIVKNVENQAVPSLPQRETIDRLADAFEAAFRAGQPMEIERLVADNPDLRPYLLKELISLEFELRRSLGKTISVDEYRSRFSQDAWLVEEVLSTTEVHGDVDQKCDANENVIVDSLLPGRIGRYVIQRVLGKGGFGVVYLANDPQLDRLVALKFPRRERFTTTDQVPVHESTRTAHKVARFGTPTMMAPEQVGGEGHRLDGRTDIWALGVMLYELLVNQKPFTANTRDELFNEIETLDRPARSIVKFREIWNAFVFSVCKNDARTVTTLPTICERTCKPG